MDVGVGHTLKGSNRASTIVLVVSGVLMVAGAVWIGSCGVVMRIYKD